MKDFLLMFWADLIMWAAGAFVFDFYEKLHDLK